MRRAGDLVQGCQRAMQIMGPHRILLHIHSDSSIMVMGHGGGDRAYSAADYDIGDRSVTVAVALSTHPSAGRNARGYMTQAPEGTVMQPATGAGARHRW